MSSCCTIEADRGRKLDSDAVVEDLVGVLTGEEKGEGSGSAGVTGNVD